MLKFLRENWIWIVAPIVVVAVILGLLAWVTSSSDPVEPFQYPLH